MKMMPCMDILLLSSSLVFGLRVALPFKGPLGSLLNCSRKGPRHLKSKFFNFSFLNNYLNLDPLNITAYTYNLYFKGQIEIIFMSITWNLKNK